AVELDGGAVTVRVSAGPDACEECLVPKALMTQLVLQALGNAGMGIPAEQVRLTYPGEQSGRERAPRADRAGPDGLSTPASAGRARAAARPARRGARVSRRLPVRGCRPAARAGPAVVGRAPPGGPDEDRPLARAWVRS